MNHRTIAKAELADFLRVARTEAGLSQQALARRVGVSRLAVVRWEMKADGQIPQNTKLRELAAVLGVPIKELAKLVIAARDAGSGRKE